MGACCSCCSFAWCFGGTSAREDPPLCHVCGGHLPWSYTVLEREFGDTRFRVPFRPAAIVECANCGRFVHGWVEDRPWQCVDVMYNRTRGRYDTYMLRRGDSGLANRTVSICFESVCEFELSSPRCFC